MRVIRQTGRPTQTMADSENRPDEDYPSTPTEWEEETLRRVCDKIPWTIFLVAVAELAERFTYRCITAPMRKLSLW